VTSGAGRPTPVDYNPRMMAHGRTNEREITRRLVALLTALALLAVSTSSLLARPTERRSTWDELSRMITGMDIRVVLPDATRVRGRAIEMRPDALVIDVRRTSNKRLHMKGRTEIPRSDVSTIELFIRRSPGDRSVEQIAGGIGAAIGAVAVSPLLLRLGETDKISNSAAWATFIGAAAGGAVIAIGITHRYHANSNHVLITVIP